MRVVFCGTAGFAVPSLRACAEHHEVAAVVTQPERPGSRGRPAPRPVGDAAAALQLPVLQPERIRAPEAVTAVLGFDIDALLVASYGQIIPPGLLEGPRFGGVNVHASLLPRWRGASPVAAAILAGDEQTGVSIMRMEAGLDTGPVYAASSLSIGMRETASELTARLAEMGAPLLLQVLCDLEQGRATAVSQDDEWATVARRLRREDGVVDWRALTAVEVDRRVRGLQPWPGVTAPLAGIAVRLLDGEPRGVESAEAAGTVTAITGDAADVATRAGTYRIHEVQPSGGRPMSAAAFLRGRR